MIAKAELRRVVRERLALLTPVDRAEKSARICEVVVGRPEWQQAMTVALFAPHQNEPDIDPLWLHVAGKRICYPRVVGERLQLMLAGDLEQLKTSRWGLREPEHALEKVVSLEQIDLLLVPGLAFSRDRGRLGRGGGFYDRLLGEPLLRARKFGICFNVQFVEELPRETHDRTVDAVITESGVAE